MSRAFYISRKAAITAGLKKYFTGQPCSRGHVADRYVSTRTCFECNKESGSRKESVEYRRVYYAAKYQANPKAFLEKGKKYNATERGRTSTIVRACRRRCNLLRAEGNHTHEDLSAIRTAQKDCCAYCSVALNGKGSLDHIVALTRGGTNWPNNLQWLCRSCNSRKHTKVAQDFVIQTQTMNG